MHNSSSRRVPFGTFKKGDTVLFTRDGKEYLSVVTRAYDCEPCRRQHVDLVDDPLGVDDLDHASGQKVMLPIRDAATGTVVGRVRAKIVGAVQVGDDFRVLGELTVPGDSTSTIHEIVLGKGPVTVCRKQGRVETVESLTQKVANLKDQLQHQQAATSRARAEATRHQGYLKMLKDGLAEILGYRPLSIWQGIDHLANKVAGVPDGGFQVGDAVQVVGGSGAQPYDVFDPETGVQGLDMTALRRGELVGTVTKIDLGAFLGPKGPFPIVVAVSAPAAAGGSVWFLPDALRLVSRKAATVVPPTLAPSPCAEVGDIVEIVATEDYVTKADFKVGDRGVVVAPGTGLKSPVVRVQGRKGGLWSRVEYGPGCCILEPEAYRLLNVDKNGVPVRAGSAVRVQRRSGRVDDHTVAAVKLGDRRAAAVEVYYESGGWDVILPGTMRSQDFIGDRLEVVPPAPVPLAVGDRVRLLSPPSFGTGPTPQYVLDAGYVAGAEGVILDVGDGRSAIQVQATGDDDFWLFRADQLERLP
jgi:hypothetical protein